MILNESSAYQHEKNYSEANRKALGIHYTPDAIVDYIVRKTLAPFFKESNSFISIRIIDPACGSGLFLLKAFDVLAEQWLKHTGNFTCNDAQYLIENCLFGIDIDEQAVCIAKQYLLEKAFNGKQPLKIKFNLIVDDALTIKKNQQTELISCLNNATHASYHQYFDCVIGNPPYIRIQNNSAKINELQSVYQTAQGRFDLSSLFFELAAFLLKNNGRLGFIVSNKLLTTSAAKIVRQFLAFHFCITDITDLSDTKLFNAAVLPLILIAERSTEKNKLLLYSHITQTNHPSYPIEKITNLLSFLSNLNNFAETCVEQNNKVFQIKRFQTTLPNVNNSVWTFHNEIENNVLDKLKSQSACILDNLCEKISVGLKTTADNVFIKPMTQQFIIQHQFEPQLVFPVLESENVKRWYCKWQPEQDLSVLYPYLKKDEKLIPIDLNNYPFTASYLQQHRTQLEGRTYLQQAKRQWYEIWVHHSPTSFQQRKIVTPDISTHNCFALDEKNFFVNGTCFYIVLKNNSQAFYYAMLGLLNSNVIEYFHKVSNNNTLYAKRFRYWTSYIKYYPIPKKFMDSIKLQTQLAENTAQLCQARTQEEIAILENYNNALCYQLFDLTKTEIQEITNRLASFKL
jgi:tRNA1(Val) A37 N6-methylase TrmN6